MKRIPRWALAVAAAVLIAGAADAVLFFRTDRGHAHATAGAPATEGVAVLDAHGRVLGRLTVGAEPTELAATAGSVWVLNNADGSVSRIDERSRRVVRTIRPAQPVDGFAAGDGALWLTGRDGIRTTMLRRLDLASGNLGSALRLDLGSAFMAAGAGALWTTGFVEGDVRRGARADERTGALQVLDARVFGDLIVAGRRTAYYVTSLGARVQRVDGRTGRLLRSLSLADVHDLVKGKVPPNPTGLALGAGSLWLSQTDGSVLRIDPSLTRVTRTITACGNAIAIAYGDGAVWAACGEGTAVRIDPATNRAGEPVALGGGLPRGIAAGGGSVWVSVN